jgi:hypothetical protein
MNVLKAFIKQFGLKSAGAEITPEILAQINQYALKALNAEEVYVRKVLLAHNAVDRDRERFPEILLDDFARTLPGKSVLWGHERPGPGFGLFFAANTEEISPEQFKILTGEEARLSDGVAMVKILWGSFYMVKNPGNKYTLQNLDAGIYRHVSIGFRAADLLPIKGQFDEILYWEYKAPGEATEGSLVWLGAQPGATVQKQYKEDHKGGLNAMEQFLKRLKEMFGKAFTADGVFSELKALMDEKDARIKELEPLAMDGKAYREDLVKNYVALKAKLGDIGETPEAQIPVKAVAAGYPLDFLKTEVLVLEKRVQEKFPAEGQLAGDMRRDKSADGAKGGEEDNPLIPK